jgi:ribosomal 30S subunit maturation factor RimM
LLEGGFDSINTYDTGFLSVGFIQFATLEGGSGSVGELLLYEKKHSPSEYTRDFLQFGVDVTQEGVLVVVDPSTGVELRAREAVLKVVDDKRLAAVFQLAGLRSTAFRAAQINVAKNRYYPADLPIQVTLNGQTLTGRVRDIIRSEAGLATLFDRKVNLGNIRLLNQVLTQTMVKRNLTKLDQLIPFEREIITAMKWRRDFLKDATLQQPN